MTLIIPAPLASLIPAQPLRPLYTDVDPMIAWHDRMELWCGARGDWHLACSHAMMAGRLEAIDRLLLR